MPEFTIGATDFLLDGKPFRVLAGALHYFRVHPEQWADRIHKARLLGLNTIETYVAWNAHSPQEGEFQAAGQLDLGRFLDLVAAEGMYAIVRPGPYICAEWDNGGLPAWLFLDGGTGIRRNEPRYLAAIAQYVGQVFPLIEARQIDRGGPVILVQIENEYGAYGSDKEYLRALVALARAAGIRVPLTTIDQPTDEMLSAGGLPELHKTASFGSHAAERLATLRRHQPTGPLMCAEFWDGWFDNWGAHHHTTSVAQSAGDLDELLAAGASVNLYMFQGGTNFAFTSGANDKGVYQPTTTSYDYDAPLSESGHPTAKYFAFRDVIARYAPVPAELPPAAEPAPEFAVELARSLPLRTCLALLGEWSAFDHLPTADELGARGGFTVYRTQLDADCRVGAPGSDASVLTFGEVRDRAQVFVDGAPVGVLAREQGDRSITVPARAAGTPGVLEVLVEDQGRVNYGPRLGEPKGLIGPATLGGAQLRRWEALQLDLDRLPLVRASLAAAPPGREGLPGPSFAAGEFDLSAPADLFLQTTRWGKGVAWLNGFNLGRYWSRGPQHTLYVPAPATQAGRNELLVLELTGLSRAVARFVSGADLGHTEP